MTTDSFRFVGYPVRIHAGPDAISSLAGEVDREWFEVIVPIGAVDAGTLMNSSDHLSTIDAVPGKQDAARIPMVGSRVNLFGTSRVGFSFVVNPSVKLRMQGDQGSVQEVSPLSQFQIFETLDHGAECGKGPHHGQDFFEVF